MNPIKWLANKWKKYDIIKTVDGHKVLYLRRYFIWRSRWFNIYLHHICRPDEDKWPHDHPWSFVSIVLRGGYTEAIFNWIGQRTQVTERKTPSIGFRRGYITHMITSVKENTWTLVFTGKRERSWGFLTDKGEWIHWRKYLNTWENLEMD